MLVLKLNERPKAANCLGDIFEREPSGDEWELLETNEIILDFEDLDESDLQHTTSGKMVGLLDSEEPVLQLDGHVYKGERNMVRGTGVIFNVSFT